MSTTSTTSTSTSTSTTTSDSKFTNIFKLDEIPKHGRFTSFTSRSPSISFLGSSISSSVLDSFLSSWLDTGNTIYTRNQDPMIKTSTDQYGSLYFETNSTDKSSYVHNLHQANNFVKAYWECFTRHGSAVFSPSDIWLAVALSFSRYCARYPLALKPHINPDFNGEKKTLLISHDGVWDWRKEIDNMVELVMQDSYNPDFIGGLKNDLACATPLERTACNVAIMKSVEYYYRYQFQSRCGFNYIKFLGEQSDWILLKDKVLALAKYNFEKYYVEIPATQTTETNSSVTETTKDTKTLPKGATDTNSYLLDMNMKWEDYIKSVVEVLDKFIDAFTNPDKDFFRNMVHNTDKYGFYGDKTNGISGWILKFFYGFMDSYVVSEVPIIEACVSAQFDPTGAGVFKDVTIQSGWSGYEKIVSGAEHEYRPVTYCSVFPNN